MEYSTSVVSLSHSFYTLEVLSFKKTSILNTDVTVQFVNQSVNPFGYVLCVCVWYQHALVVGSCCGMDLALLL